MLLGIGAYPWDGSQVGTVIHWSFSQSMLLHMPAILVERINFGLKVLLVVWYLYGSTAVPV